MWFQSRVDTLKWRGPTRTTFADKILYKCGSRPSKENVSGNIVSGPDAGNRFFLVDSALKEEAIILMAVGAYGLYRTVNTLRHAHTPLEPRGLLWFFIKQGVEHSKARTLLKYDGEGVPPEEPKRKIRTT